MSCDGFGALPKMQPCYDSYLWDNLSRWFWADHKFSDPANQVETRARLPSPRGSGGHPPVRAARASACARGSGIRVRHKVHPHLSGDAPGHRTRPARPLLSPRSGAMEGRRHVGTPTMALASSHPPPERGVTRRAGALDVSALPAVAAVTVTGHLASMAGRPCCLPAAPRGRPSAECPAQGHRTIQVPIGAPRPNFRSKSALNIT